MSACLAGGGVARPLLNRSRRGAEERLARSGRRHHGLPAALALSGPARTAATVPAPTAGVYRSSGACRHG